MTNKIKLAMLIDDEMIDQKQYQRALQRSGLVDEIMTFTYAEDALAYLADNPDVEVDVILLDINMPRMNGFEFLSAATDQLGSGFAKIVVAMLTTSLDPEDRRRACEFEVVKEFMNKPLTFDQIEHITQLLPDVAA